MIGTEKRERGNRGDRKNTNSQRHCITKDIVTQSKVFLFQFASCLPFIDENTMLLELKNAEYWSKEHHRIA
jgi:hypothetical protein